MKSLKHFGHFRSYELQLIKIFNYRRMCILLILDYGVLRETKDGFILLIIRESLWKDRASLIKTFSG